MDLITQRDWVIDTCPDTGNDGGCIVVKGTPTKVVAHATSKTPHYLKKAGVN